MTIQARLVVAGMSATAAQASVGTTANNLTATTGGQSGAAPLTADTNRFTTVPAGSGCIIPPLNGSDCLTVLNAGANTLLLYPPAGAQLNSLGVNQPYSILTTTPYCEITCITPTQYHCFQSS